MTDDGGYLHAAFRVLRLRLTDADEDELEAAIEDRDARREELTGEPRIEVLGRRFGLTEFERATLLMCAGTELDLGLAHACARAQGDGDRTFATFSLALENLPDAEWAAMSPAAPLRRWRLVRMTHPLVPTTSALQIDERILHTLVGVDYLDPEIVAVSTPLDAPTALTPALTDAARAVARHWDAGASAVLLHGRRLSDLRLAAASAAGGRRTYLLRDVDLPSDGADRRKLALRCEREHRLTDVVWVLEIDGAEDSEQRRALAFAERLEAPLVVTMREPSADAVRLPRFEVRSDRLADRRAVWAHALDEAPDAGGWADRLGGQFDLGPAEVRTIVAEAQTLDGPTLWAAARRRTRPAIDDLAQRIEPAVSWDDMVLPDRQRDLLCQIAVHLRHRLTVLDDWGFGARDGRGVGTAALFTGPSGTGKTLAAEVIAHDVGLDLFRVDLSQTISKYIGETEKHLRRIFDAAEAGGAVLLFDEADALFGKRSEVKDSHDRHANMQIGYLLQRIEVYRGLAVLTTNLKDSLDEAFLRRLRFIVPFPFPDETSRAEIWRRAFPAAAPTKDLDFDALARLSVSGAVIHNIALAAAFRAAAADEAVDMAHVLAAARVEYHKLERSLPAAEVAGWTT
ncbi:ATP-binding protein [Cryptosporangium sp. NPDC051539]|uniref:ATP-binding protein n=1 Tax=Cryptosporangium sp. NPDC051539 TaxID=3363962 RepID=UPI0037ADC87A